MTYSIKKTDGSGLVDLPDFVLDNTTTSITLVGKDAVNFGEEFSQNFVDMLQRFSNASAPITPLQGQLWYDQEQSKLKVFNGTNWKIVSPAFDGYSGTVNLELDSYPKTTVSLLITDQNVASITSYNQLNVAYLSSNVTIDGRTYELASRFPNGLEPGVNLAETSNSYVLAGQATSGNVLTTARTIRLTGVAKGEILFDGGSNVNIVAEFSNVYVGNTNVTISGTYSNITVSSNGVIQTASNISINDVVAALGYLPYSDSNVSVSNVGNTVVLRDQNGSFNANVMTGTATYTKSFSSNTTVSVNGALIGSSGNFNGTSNLIVNSNLVAMGGNLVAGVYNRITVNDTGLVTQGELVENMPIGAMVLYNGVVIPEGWARCNGSNVTTPDGSRVTTPNLSNVLVGSSFYIMKAWSNLDLPSNDTIVGSISINLQGGGVPTVRLVGGPNVPYPPLVWSNVNVGASGSTLPTNLELTVNDVKLRRKGKNYSVGDRLYVELPDFDKKKSKNACIRVDSIESGGIKTFTLIFNGNYFCVPSGGASSIWVKLTNYSQQAPVPNNQGYMPGGRLPRQKFWEGVPGFTKNKPRRVNENNDDNELAQFDIEGRTTANKFLVPDIDFGNDLFFDAVALILTNGDPNSVMLSQTNIYGDLSNLTIAQVMKNLETRITTGLPPRIGKYMLSYDDIVNHAGYLKCPVDITKFTIAVQNQLMVLTTSDNANRFAYSGIFPSDEKLFGAAYIGFERYRALLIGNKTISVGASLEASDLNRTFLPQIDNILVSEFLENVSKLITNAKIAVANNRVARTTTELVNQYTKKNLPMPDPILPKPLLTTGNISVIVSQATIDGLPAMVGGTRGNPTSGGGSFVKAGNDKNTELYGEINSVRYRLPSGGGGGGGGGGNPAGINPKGSFGFDTGTGTDIGVQASFSVSGPGSSVGVNVSYEAGSGSFLNAYAGGESGNRNVWNTNGAINYRNYYGRPLPDPNTLSINEAIALQDKIITANNQPGAVGNASSAVGEIQQVKANLIEARDTAGLTGNENLGASQGVLKAASLVNAARAYGAQVGKTGNEVTQSEAGMALSYGAGAASNMAKWSAANPNGTLAQFSQAYPQYSTAALTNNPPCTPNGFNTRVADIPKFCDAFHKLPNPAGSALLSELTTTASPATNLAPAVSPTAPLTVSVTATVAVTQAQLQTVVTTVQTVSLTSQQAAVVSRSLTNQGVQTPLGNSGSNGPSNVGLSESQKAAIAAGPGAFGSSQRAAYNAATGRGGSPVVGGADPALSRVNTSTPSSSSSSAGLGGSCFIRGTKILMADGTTKNAEDVMIGDVLLGMDGVHNSVIELDCPPLNYKREIPRLFGFNGGPAFVTAEHPFYSDRGWLAINATEFAIMKHNMAHLGVQQMVIGDVLHMSNGERFLVKSIDEYLDVDPEQQVFNYILDGNNTYYADGFIAHNRTAASRGYSSPSPSAGNPYSNGGGSGSSVQQGGPNAGAATGVGGAQTGASAPRGSERF